MVPWANFLLWINVLIFAAVLGARTKSLPVKLFENFYRNGSLVFGGGQVLAPLLYTEFVEELRRRRCKQGIETKSENQREVLHQNHFIIPRRITNFFQVMLLPKLYLVRYFPLAHTLERYPCVTMEQEEKL